MASALVTIVETIIAAVVVALLAATSSGEAFCPYARPPLCAPFSKSPCSSFDDYCRKCLPQTAPCCGEACNDYCSKRLPQVDPECGRLCDDYDAKCGPICLPSFCRPNVAPRRIDEARTAKR